jgi:hypothetical protein
MIVGMSARSCGIVPGNRGLHHNPDTLDIAEIVRGRSELDAWRSIDRETRFGV